VLATAPRRRALLVGTDAPNPFVVPGFAVHEELELLVQGGPVPLRGAACPRRDDLRNTLNQAGSFGTVEPGRLPIWSC
jgi:hypothetical protein